MQSMCVQAAICGYTCRPEKGGSTVNEVKRQLPAPRPADGQDLSL